MIKLNTSLGIVAVPPDVDVPPPPPAPPRGTPTPPSSADAAMPAPLLVADRLVVECDDAATREAVLDGDHNAEDAADDDAEDTELLCVGPCRAKQLL